MSYWDFSGTPKDVFQNGYNYYRDGKYNSALECFERACEKCADDEENQDLIKKCKDYIYNCERKIAEENSLKSSIYSDIEWAKGYQRSAQESRNSGYSTYETAIFNFRQAIDKLEQYLRNKNYRDDDVVYHRELIRECEENIKECEESINYIKYGD